MQRGGSKAGYTYLGAGPLFMRPKDIVIATVAAMALGFGTLMYRQKEAMKTANRNSSAMFLNEFHRDRTQPLALDLPKRKAKRGVTAPAAAVGAVDAIFEEEEEEESEVVSYATLHSELMRKGMAYIPKDPYKRQMLIDYALWLGRLNHLDKRTLTKRTQVDQFSVYTNVLMTNLFIMDQVTWDREYLSDFVYFTQKMTEIQTADAAKRRPGYEQVRKFLNEYNESVKECQELAYKKLSQRNINYAYGESLISTDSEYQIVCPAVQRILNRIREQRDRPEVPPQRPKAQREPKQM